MTADYRTTDDAEIVDDYEDEDGWEDDDGDAVTGGDIIGPKGPRVCADKCSTCIFHPGNRMQLRSGRVRQMVQDALDGGGFITCHSTLPSTAGRGQAAICRGFFDSYGHLSNIIRIYSRLGGWDEIEPPKLHD
jgi:hypothetical protein